MQHDFLSIRFERLTETQKTGEILSRLVYLEALLEVTIDRSAIMLSHVEDRSPDEVLKEMRTKVNEHVVSIMNDLVKRYGRFPGPDERTLI
jgi:hypothetical protein